MASYPTGFHKGTANSKLQQIKRGRRLRSRHLIPGLDHSCTQLGLKIKGHSLTSSILFFVTHLLILGAFHFLFGLWEMTFLL